MPRQRTAVLESKIDFAKLVELNLLEKTIKPFIASKIKQLLGVEE
jgi:hypothetical protein